VPKETWNINDFSGGVNKIVDSRDIEDNQSDVLNNLIAYHPGSLRTGGYFIPLSNNYSFELSNNSDNLPATYLQPSAPLIQYLQIATTTVGADSKITFTTNDSEFPLSIGMKISVISVNNSDFEGLLNHTYTIESDNGSGVYTSTYHETLGGAIAGSDTNTKIILGASTKQNTNGNYELILYNDPKHNRYIIMNNGFGKFGFWHLASQSFYGSNSLYAFSNGFGKDFFNTEWLWNWRNVNRLNDKLHTPDASDVSLNKPTSSVKTKESMYSDGVLRVIEESPSAFENGFCKHPVGLFYIEGHSKFGQIPISEESVSQGVCQNALHYMSGWYPLPSHCWSPGHYQTITGDASNFIRTAGILTTSAQTTGATIVSNSHIAIPNSSNRINICISGKTGNGSGQWQCGSSGEHEYIGLGISYIYDDIDQETDGNYSQESSITNLTISDNDETAANSIQVTGGEDNCQLLVAFSVNKTFDNISTVLHTDSAEYQSGAGLNTTVLNSYERTEDVQINDGFSNNGTWNPRVVGANIYVTSYTEKLSNPLLLGTINFYADHKKYGESESHDSNKSGPWVLDGDMQYGSFKVESIPILDYYTKNLYKHDEQHMVYYKTSAMVNRKLYVGNVSYFASTDPLSMGKNTAIENHPDRILMSVSPNKFDIFPVGLGLDLAKFDGQDIVALKNFNNLLLVFKTNDLFIIDCSGERESLAQTFLGKGVSTQRHIVVTTDIVFFANASGLYAFDGQQIVDLIEDKIPNNIWENNILNPNSNLYYDYEQSLLILSTSHSETSYEYINRSTENVGKIIIYNLKTKSLFFKDKPSSKEVSLLSQGLNVENKLIGFTNEISEQAQSGPILSQEITTNYAQGGKSAFFLQFRLSGDGHTSSSVDCPVGVFNNKSKYIKIFANKQESLTGGSPGSPWGWITLNPNNPLPSTGYGLPTNTDNQSVNTQNAINNYLASLVFLQSRINMDTDYHGYKCIDTNMLNQDPDWLTTVAPSSGIFGWLTDGFIQVVIESTLFGGYYNLASPNGGNQNPEGQDLSSLGEPYISTADNSGKFSFAFSDNNVDSNTTDTITSIFQSVGQTNLDVVPNIRRPSRPVIVDTNGDGLLDFVFNAPPPKYVTNFGTNGFLATMPVYEITPDVNADLVASGTKIYFTAKTNFSNNISSFTATGEYIVGENYFAGTNYQYTDESTLSAKADINARLVLNLYQAIVDGHLNSSSSTNLTDVFNVTKTSTKLIFTGNANFTYFNGTYVGNTQEQNNIIFSMDFVNLSNKSTINIWNNFTEDISESINHDFLYITKDIDFGQPNVRKKIYKAYITYTGGKNIQCYYKANQSASFNNATVYDENGDQVEDYYTLPESSVQTRAELKFGSGGNNIYSFALKFEGEASKDFKINDISLVYRLKKPK